MLMSILVPLLSIVTEKGNSALAANVLATIMLVTVYLDHFVLDRVRVWKVSTFPVHLVSGVSSLQCGLLFLIIFIAVLLTITKYPLVFMLSYRLDWSMLVAGVLVYFTTCHSHVTHLVIDNSDSLQVFKIQLALQHCSMWWYLPMLHLGVAFPKLWKFPKLVLSFGW